MAQKTALTFNENGRAITETIDDIEMPIEMSFECVNEFVHSFNVSFEDLQCLCLGLAEELENNKKMTSAEKTALNKFNKAIRVAGEN